MKKALFILIILVGSVAGIMGMLGLSPAYVISAPGVAGGMGSKILCSARYVSGFSEQQAFDDLIQYSSVLKYLAVDYNTAEQSVTTSLSGLGSATAVYLPGIGCANQYRGFNQRETLQTRELPVFNSQWPHGNRVETIDAKMQEAVTKLLEQDNADGLNTRAVLVAYRGQIIAEAYGQNAGPDTPLLGWSMAKSLMSVMIGNLEFRGLLNAQQPPGFSEWAGDERSAVRIDHLLTMTDGLGFSEQYNPGDDATAMLFTEASTSAYALSKPMINEPGNYFNYSSGTANLLSRLYFERTGGTAQSNYDDFIHHIAIPLSFQHSVFETDASGVFIGSSYLYASARDWARLGQMMLNNGVLNGQRVVSADWVARSTQANGSSNGPAYGYQWWLNRGADQLRWPDLPEDSYSAQGNRHQYLMLIPSKELLIVRLGWTSGSYPVNERFAQIIADLESTGLFVQ
jgi:CubicO group peptidase (beta-lactamase class C family)